MATEFLNFKNPEGRWLEFLSSFDTKLQHRPGRSRKNADGVCRIPCQQCDQIDVDNYDEKGLRLSINQLEHDANENANLNLKEAQLNIETFVL